MSPNWKTVNFWLNLCPELISMMSVGLLTWDCLSWCGSKKTVTTAKICFHRSWWRTWRNKNMLFSLEKWRPFFLSLMLLCKFRLSVHPKFNARHSRPTCNVHLPPGANGYFVQKNWTFCDQPIRCGHVVDHLCDLYNKRYLSHSFMIHYFDYPSSSPSSVVTATIIESMPSYIIHHFTNCKDSTSTIPDFWWEI